jgi:hypothetical protein
MSMRITMKRKRLSHRQLEHTWKIEKWLERIRWYEAL